MSIQTRHPRAYDIARTIPANPFSWYASKDQLKAVVDAITDDVLAGQDLAAVARDPFLLAVLQDYAAQGLIALDAELGWDAPRMSDATEDYFLGWLARRWLFWRVTGRLR